MSNNNNNNIRLRRVVRNYIRWSVEKYEPRIWFTPMFTDIIYYHYRIYYIRIPRLPAESSENVFGRFDSAVFVLYYT